MATIISLAARKQLLQDRLHEQQAKRSDIARHDELQDVASPRIAEVLDAWCDARIADGNQVRGVQRYCQQMDAFLDWTGVDIRVNQLSRRLITDYKTALGSRPTGRRRRTDPEGTLVSPGTTRNALTTLRAFCDWCVEREYLTENPAMSVKLPKVIPPPPNVLTRAQIGELFIAIDTRSRTHAATYPRNRRAVLLMLYAGLRREEVANLRWGDVDLGRRDITVRYGKGGRSRIVPICTELAEELSLADSPPASAAVVDKGDGLSAMGHKCLGHVFERWLPSRWPVAQGELPPLVSPHTLRRTFATELYVRGVDILTIQRLLGHSDPKTTLRYIAASSEKERAAVELLRFRAELPQSERTSDEREGVERLCFRQ